MRKYAELNERQKEELSKIFETKISDEEIGKFFDSYVNVLKAIKNKECINVITSLVHIKPIYKFQTVFYLIREYIENENEIQEDLNLIRKYIGFRIDLFVLVNMISF